LTALTVASETTAPDGSVTVPVMAPKVCWADANCVRKASATATIREARKDFEAGANTRKAGDSTFKPPVMEALIAKGNIQIQADSVQKRANIR
jgi:hypothetical protein